ncbi:hypothetical protein ACVWZ6_002315 [Bradyrhizobium sp. GM6.1]
MLSLVRNVSGVAIRSLYVALASCFLGGCAEVQMGYNVLTYDNAIADTANQLLLLNAVRASQHYPKSFTSVGQLAASPPISGSLASTLNFTSLAGLQTYSLNPSASAGAGYSQFSLGNLNAQKFMLAMRAPVRKEITAAFRESTGLLSLHSVQTLSRGGQAHQLSSLQRKTCSAVSSCEGTVAS